MKIQLLKPKIRSYISAGEVILRPASIVKELLENSVDAGSSKIEVKIYSGGIDGIVVSDNGCGISREDLPNAVAVHYTSKIREIEDVFNISSFGYRGEALSSICSVSDFSISSYEADAECGWQLHSNLENTTKISPISMGVGTKIEVRDLFFNVPVRRSFLNSSNTEYRHCLACFFDYVLSFFEIDFDFFSDDKLVYSFRHDNDGDTSVRVASVLGDDFIKNSVKIENERGKLQINGLLGLPNIASKRAINQYFYVNKRPVKEGLINHLLKEALSDIIYGSYYLPYVLNITLPYGDVDVNIHPQKSQIRYKNFTEVRSFLYSSLRMVYEQISPVSISQPISAASRDRLIGTNMTASFELDDIPDNEPRVEIGIKESPMLAREFGLGQPMGTINDIYLLAKNEIGLVLIDIHAASERIIFEELKEKFSFDKIKNNTQRLLLPEKIHFTSAEVEIFEGVREDLKMLGFEVSKTAPNIYSLHEMPTFLDQMDMTEITDLVRSLVIEVGAVSERGEVVLSNILNEKLADIACKKAVKAGDKLSVEDQKLLLEKISKTPRGNQCNHGRPSWVQIDMADLNYIFSRGK